MKGLVGKWIHRLAHLTGWNCGLVETWWEGKRLMVGFRCECGELSGVSETYMTANATTQPRAGGE